MRTWVGPEAPSMKRLVATVGVGIVVVVAVAAFAPWQLDVLVFWDGVATTFLVIVWSQIFRLDSTETAAHAVREDDTRTMSRFVLVGASTVSLVGVGLALAKAIEEGGSTEILMSTFAVVTIVLSWGVVHTVYVLRYAHLYYD